MNLLFLLFFFGAPCVWASNILGIAPIPSKSHSILMQSLMISLAEAGHNVTYVSCFPLKRKIANLNEIFLPFSMDDVLKKLNLNLFDLRHQSTIRSVLNLPSYCLMICENQLKSKELQQLLKSGSHYDLIIVEWFYTESIAAGLAERFKAPLVAFSPLPADINVNYFTGNIAPTSTFSDPQIGFPAKMSFTQRLGNFLFHLLRSLQLHLLVLPKQEALYLQHFGSESTPMKEHIYNISLAFVNDHHSLTHSRPLLPNVVQMGGVHVPSPKKLPQDLQMYLDNSKDGAILFSMGSNLKSSAMSQEKISALLNAFGKLKQNILWKFEKDLEGKPPNVLISDWLPQSDILAHPNIKLFITHGGLLSTTEAVDRGVPIIGIPILADQPANMKNSVNVGFGLILNYDDISEETVESAIKEVLENPKYSEAAKSRSRLLKDQPMSQIQNALYWVDYVIRHKGARHFRQASLDLSWYEFHQLDVIAVILVAFYFIIRTIVKILGSIKQLIFGVGKKNAKTEKKIN